ncbi:MAG: hypothetical protein U0840_24990 [Gemmataceae bacterium]
MTGDTLGSLLALNVTVASEQERAQVAELATRVQEVTGNRKEVAFVDQSYTGQSAEYHWKTRASGWRWSAHGGDAGIRAVATPEGGLADVWLARDYKRRAPMLAGWHGLAFLSLLVTQLGDSSQ